MPNMVESFEAIEEAVLESPRGRWFLAEYASRLRTRESAAIAGQITALEAAVNSNHDAIMARIAQALAQPPGAAAAPQPQPQPDLAPRHMKYFKKDEDIFEPAAKPLNIVKAAPEEKRGAKLTITRVGAPAPEPVAASPAEAVVAEVPPPEPPVLAAPEAPAEPVAVSEPAAPRPDAAPEEAPKRRIVIIRHKPGEAITVPLQNEAPAPEPELAEAG